MCSLTNTSSVVHNNFKLGILVFEKTDKLKFWVLSYLHCSMRYGIILKLG